MNSKPLVGTWSKLPWAAQLKCVEYMDDETRYCLKLCSRFNKTLVEYFLLHVEYRAVKLQSFKFWNQLPWDVMLKCVENMDRYSRKSLKCCSSDHNYLVKHANSIFPLPPAKKLGYCEVLLKRNTSQNFKLEFRSGRNEYSGTMKIHHYSMHSVESYVQKAISEFEIFDKVRIRIENCPGFKLHPLPFLLACRKLHLTYTNFSIMTKVLKQFDPTSLEKLSLTCLKHSKSDEMWDMEQLTRVKKLEITGNGMNDDQLEQVEAEKLRIFQSERITSTGINKYIKKRLLCLDKCECEFEIDFIPDPFTIENLCRDLDVVYRTEDSQRTVFIVNSPFPEFQLEFSECFDSVEGKKIVKKDQNSHLKRRSSEISEL